MSLSYLQGRWRASQPEAVLKGVVRWKQRMWKGGGLCSRGHRAKSGVKAGLSRWRESASHGDTQGPAGKSGMGHRDGHTYTWRRKGEGLER